MGEVITRTRKYTPEQIDGALLAYATLGNSEAASEAVGIPPTTIRGLKQRYPQRYQELQQKHSREIEKALVIKIRDNVLKAADGVDRAVALEVERLNAGGVKDAAGSARNLATVVGIGVTKVLELEGRPTSIVEHRRAEDIIRSLASLGHVDGTAEEIEDSAVSVADGR